MNRDKLTLLIVLCLALTMAACAEDDDDDDALQPIDITPGVAISEPDTPTDAAVEPAVAYDGTHIHLVYCQDDGTGIHDIVYTRRLGGGGFSSPADVFPASSSDSRNPHVHLEDDGTLHIVWVEGTSPNGEIYYATRSSGGTISAPANMTNSAEDETNPRVHVDSTGRVHIVWEGATPAPNSSQAVFYRRTQGAVFLAAEILPKADGGQPAEMPDITTDQGDRIYVVWSELNGSARNIRLVRSDDNGANFGSVGGSDFAASGGVDMTEARVAGGLDGEVWLTFIGEDSQAERGLFATFTRTGGTMAQPGILATSNTGGLRDPELAVFRRDDDEFTVVIVVNDGGTNGGSILGFASHDNGETYPGDPANFSQGNSRPATNRKPVVDLDDNELIVAWQGEPQGGGIVRTWSSNSDYSLPED